MFGHKTKPCTIKIRAPQGCVSQGLTVRNSDDQSLKKELRISNLLLLKYVGSSYHHLCMLLGYKSHGLTVLILIIHCKCLHLDYSWNSSRLRLNIYECTSFRCSFLIAVLDTNISCCKYICSTDGTVTRLSVYYL